MPAKSAQREDATPAGWYSLTDAGGDAGGTQENSMRARPAVSSTHRAGRRQPRPPGLTRGYLAGVGRAAAASAGHRRQGVGGIRCRRANAAALLRIRSTAQRRTIISARDVAAAFAGVVAGGGPPYLQERLLGDLLGLGGGVHHGADHTGDGAGQLLLDQAERGVVSAR
jgi:hypothetical protein